MTGLLAFLVGLVIAAAVAFFLASSHRASSHYHVLPAVYDCGANTDCRARYCQGNGDLLYWGTDQDAYVVPRGCND